MTAALREFVLLLLVALMGGVLYGVVNFGFPY
jgi:hypothetical protein